MTILPVYVLFIISLFCSGEFLNLLEILSRFIFTSKREKEETKKMFICAMDASVSRIKTSYQK